MYRRIERVLNSDFGRAIVFALIHIAIILTGLAVALALQPRYPKLAIWMSMGFIVYMIVLVDVIFRQPPKETYCRFCGDTVDKAQFSTHISGCKEYARAVKALHV